ncbi:MAG: DUF3347 domain-containing protein [Cyclonatronaceae bacterium]
MNKYNKYLIILILLFATAACGGETQSSGESAGEEEQTQTATAETQAEYDAPGPFLERLEEGTEHYLMLSSALVEDNREEAVRYSGLMRETLADADTDALSDEALQVWSEKWAIIDTRARALEEAADLESQRYEFEFLSEAMIELVEGFDPLSFDVYVQRCPMVRDGSADWLSRNEDILNPYHGDSMLTCGSVIREL